MTLTSSDATSLPVPFTFRISLWSLTRLKYSITFLKITEQNVVLLGSTFSPILISSCVCVYVCCAALSPSFYFCLHSSSFVCSTSSVPSSFLYPTHCTWLCLSLLLSYECLCFCMEPRLPRSEEALGKKEQPGKYKQTQQQLPTSTLHYKFPTRQNISKV